MSQRPRCAPEVVAALAERAPGRVRRKLDKQSDVAAGWQWRRDGDQWTVTAGSESVRLKVPGGVLRTTDDVACSCLLSPRCFHALACVSVLDLDDGAAAPATAEPDDTNPPPEEPTAGKPAAVLDDQQRHAAELAWRAGAALLATGARAAGSLIQADLLRAVHECRARGLHRLAAAGLRAVESVRQARRDDPAFALDALARDLAEHLACAHRLRQAPGAPVPRELLGTARRRYHPFPGQRLYGLFAEPVLTRSGYAGVVTYLVAPDRRILTLSNVAPGDGERVAEAWLGGVSLGDLALSHRDLSRSGLFVQKGTAAADGRLGAGQACRAVTASACDWHQPPLAELFATPVAEQVSGAFERATSGPGRGAPPPAGADLLFLRGRVRGKAKGGVAFDLAGGAGGILLQAPAQGPRQPSRDNLDVLARAPGLALRCVVRLVRHLAGVAELLAIAGDEETNGGDRRPRLVLGDDRAGRLSCGLERLERAHLTSAHRRPVPVPGDGPGHRPAAGLDPLERALGQLALGGRHSLPHGSVRRRDRDAARLVKSGLPAAAAQLQTLSRQALEVDRAFDGVRFPTDPAPLASGWLAAMCYANAARDAFQRRVWLELLRS